MPIDSSLFRAPHEGGNVQEVLQWQRVRLLGGGVGGDSSSSSSILDSNSEKRTDDDDSNSTIRVVKFEQIQVLIQNMEKWDLQRRRTQTKLNETRSTLKTLQKSLAPPSRQRQRQSQHLSDKNDRGSCSSDATMDKISIKEQIQHLKTQIIPDLEQSLHTVTLQIEQSIPKVANIVDHDINDKLRQHQRQQQKQQNQQIRTCINKVRADHVAVVVSTDVMDPLYCLGGYETLSLENNHNKINSKPITILSGIGAELFQALSSLAISFLLDQSQSTASVSSSSLGSTTTAITKTTPTPKYQILQLPESINIPSSLAHNLWGCSASSCSVCSEIAPVATMSPVNVVLPSLSSLTSFSLLHGKKSYQDRQLPLFFVNQTTTSAANATNTANTTMSMDNRPLLFQRTSSTSSSSTTTTTVKKKKSPSLSSWMEQLPPNQQQQQIEIFALTACSMVEAQRVQLQMVQRIIDFHRSLLLVVDNDGDGGGGGGGGVQQEEEHKQTETSSTTSICFTTNKIRTRVESSINLLPCEASRIVIEGYLPPPPLPSSSLSNKTTTKTSQTSSKDKTQTTCGSNSGSYVVLGYVSNFTDYMTRPCKVKCGTSGVGNETEFVYTLHGVLSCISQSMDWMIRNNSVNVKTTATKTSREDVDNGELGVGIPCTCLSSSFGNGSLATLLHNSSSTTYEDSYSAVDDVDQERNPYTTSSSNQNFNDDNDNDDVFLFIPFQRRVHYGKNGKMRYEDLHANSKYMNTTSRRNQPCSDRRFVTTNKKRSGSKTTPTIKQEFNKQKHNIISTKHTKGNYCSGNNPSFTTFGVERMPTQQDIKNEACTNPYNGFLPFY